jgi:hypothetical protein
MAAQVRSRLSGPIQRAQPRIYIHLSSTDSRLPQLDPTTSPEHHLLHPPTNFSKMTTSNPPTAPANTEDAQRLNLISRFEHKGVVHYEYPEELWWPKAGFATAREERDKNRSMSIHSLPAYCVHVLMRPIPQSSMPLSQAVSPRQTPGRTAQERSSKVSIASR